MTEAEIIQRFQARANPPPILFRYRRPTDWALDEISKQQIYAAKPIELNDPFEYAAPVFWNLDLMKQVFIEEFAPMQELSPAEAEKEFESFHQSGIAKLLHGIGQLKKLSGVICLSAIPNSIRMWSYYAQAHEGICIGFDTKVRPFNMALEVKYQNPDIPFDIIAAIKNDPTEIASHISLRKAEEWKFEEEYRIPISIGDNPRLIPFNPSAIKEIRFGARVKNEFREKVMEAVSQLPHRPTLIQMGCDFERFILTETVI
jgi:Protein of unknown function (DUF2971)